MFIQLICSCFPAWVMRNVRGSNPALPCTFISTIYLLPYVLRSLYFVYYFSEQVNSLFRRAEYDEKAGQLENVTKRHVCSTKRLSNYLPALHSQTNITISVHLSNHLNGRIS